MDKRRIFTGYWDATAAFFREDIRITVLVALLNMKRGVIPTHPLFKFAEAKYWTEKAKVDLIALVTGLHQASELFEALPDLPDVPTRRETDERMRLLDSLNSLFERCVTCPAVGFQTYSDPTGKTLFIDDSISTTNTNPVEVMAMLGVKELFRTNRLSALKHCASDSCNDWFFARRSDQTFCVGKGCRQREFQKTEDFKESRRRTYQSRKELAKAKPIRKASNAKTIK